MVVEYQEMFSGMFQQLQMLQNSCYCSGQGKVNQKVFLGPKVYLRLWHFNIFDGEIWPRYAHNKDDPDLVDYHDLEDVWLLEGACGMKTTRKAKKK